MKHTQYRQPSLVDARASVAPAPPLAKDTRPSTARGRSGNRKILGVMSLALINVAAVISLRNLPAIAEYGWASFFVYGVSILLFMIPISYAAAELASGWAKNGGVYLWVRQAFGERWGFLAIWADWAENLVWFPTVLSFIAAAFFFMFNPGLSNSNVWLFAAMMVIFWGTTLANFLGMRASALVSTIGTVIGSIIPGLLIVILALAWILSGNQSQIPLTAGALLPHFSLTNLVLMSGVILAWAGMEMAGFHAQETKNPQRDFPRAMLISGGIIVGLSVLGTLAIALVVPLKTLNLNSGLMQAFQSFFNSLNIGWAIHPLALLVTAGGIALLSTWLFGPAKGLRRTAVEGNFPRFFQGRNRQMAPTNILIIQAVIGTAFALLYLFEPSVSTSYWILSVLTTQLLIVMYVLIFAAVIRLRYTQPDTPRPFRIPGGLPGVWLMGGLGIVGCTTAFVFGFIPPSQIPTGNPVTYVVMMVVLTLVLTLPPFIIHRFRRPSWRAPAEEIALVEAD